MKIFNKRARFDYQIEGKYEAGIVLTGGEAKAVRTGHVNLTNSYAKIVNDEVYLINANIPIQGALKYEPTKSRKLLLHKEEIVSIASKIKAKKLTLVPISIYNTHNLVKIELGLGKSKKKFEKKETIKKRDLDRDLKDL
jgi:SsrA-binding protein